MSDDHANSCTFKHQSLCIFVIGASGDLAKKKTYPSLFDLFEHGFLPPHTIICGYARSKKSDDEFRSFISAYLKTKDEEKKSAFLNLCIYRSGAYDSVSDVGAVSKEMETLENATGLCIKNRLFYFAIPPNVFVPIGTSIKHSALSTQGWNRLIVEKPFGHDLNSFNELSRDMGALYSEDEIYRIDHYLGKEMVQNLMLLRFANNTFEPLWNRNYISSVMITFKENIGTQGRGGYFDSYGIIRDVMQNHLLQVLSLVAMEPPVRASGDDYSNFVRDEKVKVLKCIEPLSLENTVLGQYVGNNELNEVGYLEDPTVPADSVTPTFATVVMNVKNARWDGVPFIMKAGKALNDKKVEVRIQFKQAPGATHMFPGVEIPRNELVLRLQPNEAVYMKTNVKSPGLSTKPVASELDLSYNVRYADTYLPEAYTRLVLDVLRGKQATFVRDDELRAAWQIFTPLLNQIESQRLTPIPYVFGTRGPMESDNLVKKFGYEFHSGAYTKCETMADPCSCARVAELEEQVAHLQSQLLRYRRKYGNLDVLDPSKGLCTTRDDGLMPTQLESSSSTLVSSSVGKHVVLDYVADSPMFRKSLDGLDEAMSGLKGFMKELLVRAKDFVTAGNHWGEMETNLAGIYSTKHSRSLFTSCYSELGDLSTILNDFHDTLAQIQSSRHSFLLSVEALLYGPIENFCDQELKQAIELKKEMVKCGEEYEALLGKSLSKQTPFYSRSSSLSITSALDIVLDDNENTTSDDKLMQARCKFEVARFDCVRYFNMLDAKKKFVLLEAFNSTLYSYLGHFHACHELVKSIEPTLRTRQANLQEARNQFEKDGAMWAQQRDLLESRLSSAYPATLPVEIISTETAQGRLLSKAEKQGFLIVRSGMFPTKSWKRIWFQIHQGKLYSIKNQKDMELTLVSDLMVSKVRACQKSLPYTFEVLDNTQSKTILQATSDADMQSWIDAAQESTESMLGLQSHRAQVDPSQPDLVRQLMEDNAVCADCGQSPSEWVSINIGAFLCIECSGIHRSLGVHVSKVRSLILDSWDVSVLELLHHHLGNTNVNAIWEVALAPGWVKPTAQASRTEKEKWIKAKYEFRGFSEHVNVSMTGIVSRLFQAAKQGNIHDIMWCIAHGVDINSVQEATKDTALHLGAKAGHALCCEYLLQNGASQTLVDGENRLPSDVAKLAGFEHIKLMLLQRMRE
ncbi:glucose-6-phosphate 1-dehydrogenase [Thraustotheca clavata]|uniref:Glucose-6-phosphate 1-dehydrogenase n=1 Tax=Thraustotheca clavata TaxID=74557 RepID=A0A1W0A1Y8_9STRA|nr:glucose-6-phosphate 1-dehydrogenase [Thraustotheca clavata]